MRMTDPIPVELVNNSPGLLIYAPAVIGGLALLASLLVAWWNHLRAVARDTQNFVRNQLTAGVTPIVIYLDSTLRNASEGARATAEFVAEVKTRVMGYGTVLGMYSRDCGTAMNALIDALDKINEVDEQVRYLQLMPPLATARYQLLSAYNAAMESPKLAVPQPPTGFVPGVRGVPASFVRDPRSDTTPNRESS